MVITINQCQTDKMSSKTSFEIKQGIKVHVIHTDLYKTNLICVMLTLPLMKETVTKNALLPFMLRRGTKNFSDQYVINQELEDMYGASFDCGVDKIGDNQVLKFYIDTINNEYTFSKENILKKSVELILDIVFNPIMENGLFKEEFLNIEKENLKQVIESKIDAKDAYAFNNCITAMYGEEGFGLYKYGYIEDIDAITAEDLTEHYNKLIQNCKIDILLSGNFYQDEIVSIFERNENVKQLRPRIENYILNNEFTEKKQKVDNVQVIEEKMDVSQGKLVIGMDVLSNMENLQATALVYNAILGDGANSLLFQNVREKESLAYTAKSSFIKQKLNIFIRCGIQVENYDKAVEVIKKQLENIKAGNFTEEQIKNAKAYLISGIKAVEEEQDTEVVFYIGQEISKTDISFEEYIQKIENVSKAEIMELAKHIEINTIYFLRD